MKIKIEYIFFLLIGIAFLSNGCSKDSNIEVSYTFDIQPIFNERCIVCHGNNAPSSNLNLTNYDSLMKGNSNRGPVVKPGQKPENSILYQKVANPNPPYGSRMPADGPPYLSDREIQLIWLWINNGAKDN